MQNQNLDGIKKFKSLKLVKKHQRRRILAVDGLVRRAVKKTTLIPPNRQIAAFVVPIKLPPVRPGGFGIWQALSRTKQVSVMAAVITIAMAFTGGMWAALNTTKSSANSQPQVLGATTSLAGDQSSNSGVAVAGSQLQNQAGASISNDVLFNTPIQNLQSYFDTINQPDILARRKNQLAEFLKEKKSPLAGSAEMIAQQEHWKLILAIAFAESTLGKNCADNNCSNIGIKPGSPIWRRYDSYNAWVVDFNRLLDKRYKDWTLEQMCGVYVKPCSSNWLLATSQILDELKSKGIE